MARDGFSIEAAERKGRDYPDWYKNEPILDRFEESYITAFWDLNTERRYELGPIPKSEIKKYIKELGIESDLQAPFSFVISALDDHYLTLKNENIMKSRQSTNAPIKGVPNG